MQIKRSREKIDGVPNENFLLFENEKLRKYFFSASDEKEVV